MTTTEQQRLRDNFLLETNFDEDGALTMVHTQNNRNNGINDIRNQIPYRSNMSVDRYSDTTLHGVRKTGENYNYFFFVKNQCFYLFNK